MQGRLLFPTDAQRFPRPLHYVLLVYLYLRVKILKRIVSKSLTLKVPNIWRRGGIATVVVEREVRVGERWYVSCFQCDLRI